MRGVRWCFGGHVRECPTGVAPRTCFHYVLITFWSELPETPTTLTPVELAGHTFQEHSLGCAN